VYFLCNNVLQSYVEFMRLLRVDNCSFGDSLKLVDVLHIDF
jgi:hypothetical protein